MSSMRLRSTALLALACALASACDSGTDRPSAILITLDTTRADALGCYGAREGITPHLDLLARESLLYDEARTVVPMTLPAHASMMTGLYPPRHTVRTNNRNPLPRSALTLAERASAAGVATAAFLSAVVLDDSLGLAQGFEVYDEPAFDGRPRNDQIDARPSSEVVAAATKWLAERDRSRPFFLWVHLFDPHAPYEPARKFLKRTRGNRYLGEVAAMDESIGELLDALRRDGALENALLVVVADHGESLGEHGEPTHANYCYETTLKVPLFARYPDGHRAGERTSEFVSVADLAPTLAEALALEALDGIDGLSLYRKNVPPDRGVYFESFYGFFSFHWSPLAGWAEPGAKYLHSSRPELYDLANDPKEERDLAALRAADVERCRRAIDAALAKPALAPEEHTLDGEIAAGLERLGYVGGGDFAGDVPHPLAPSDRPSPAERRDEMLEIYAAIDLANANELDEAIGRIERLIARFPDNNAALNYLSSWLIRQRRFEEAAVHLERLVATGAARAMAFNNLGYCKEQRGDLVGALEHYRQAHALDPALGFALENLARVLEARGEKAEAARYRRELEELTAD